MQVRVGNISAVNLDAGKIDVQFPDRVATGLWLLDSARTDTLKIDAPVVCIFPTGSGEGICLGCYYTEEYQPLPDLKIDKNVQITGELRADQNVSTGGNITASGNIKAANFP